MLFNAGTAALRKFDLVRGRNSHFLRLGLYGAVSFLPECARVRFRLLAAESHFNLYRLPCNTKHEMAGGGGKLFCFGNEEIEFVEGARPVFTEEAGEGAIGEEFASGLAGGAIIGFVAGVADALDFGAAARAR